MDSELSVVNLSGGDGQVLQSAAVHSMNATTLYGGEEKTLKKTPPGEALNQKMMHRRWEGTILHIMINSKEKLDASQINRGNTYY